MICPNCGKSLADDSTFCTGCGWKSVLWDKKSKKIRAKKASLYFLFAFLFALAVFLIILAIIEIREMV